MSSEPNSAVLDRLFDLVEKCLSPEVTRPLVGVRAPLDVQEGLDELADKCSDGTPTVEERSEYETYVRTINFIGVLPSKARAVLTSEAG